MGEIPEDASLVVLEETGGLRARWRAAAVNLRHFFTLLRPVLLPSKIAPEIARLRSLRRYVEQHRPDVILSAMPYNNIVAIWAKQTSRCPVPVVISERITQSTYCAAADNHRKWRWRYLPALLRRIYPGADAVVTVSRQVADDLSDQIGLVHPRIVTVYNPVVDDTLRSKAAQALDHRWFARHREPDQATRSDGVPVILGVGRLTEQKDFATLLRAFARVRARREAHLVILGEGRLRQDLTALARELGIDADVEMPGFVENPLQYMARSSLLVLSSEYEGLPGVLIQAMACGCPVISTRCPGGSAEILADGKYGELVAVGDAEAMAEAIFRALATPIASEVLLHRAEDFSVDHALGNYLEILDDIVARSGVVNGSANR
jgi:glycosyltransferase involved in cell wall biosynthesis